MKRRWFWSCVFSFDSVVSIWIVEPEDWGMWILYLKPQSTLPYFLSPTLYWEKICWDGHFLIQVLQDVMHPALQQTQKMRKYWSLCSRPRTLEREREQDNHLHSVVFHLRLLSWRQMWYSLNLIHDFVIDFPHSTSTDFLMMSHWVIPVCTCQQRTMRQIQLFVNSSKKTFI